ncbi:MAG: M1 family metallopeptidase [Polyangiaceae bacterium]
MRRASSIDSSPRGRAPAGRRGSRAVGWLLLVGAVLSGQACVPQEPAAPIPPVYHAPPPSPQAPPPQAPVMLPEQVPLGRLPSDVRPLRAALFLQIDPREERFAGTIEIEVELTRARDRIWLHGKGIHARSASIRAAGMAPVPAEYAELDPSGVAVLRAPRALGPGRAVIRIDYDAAFAHDGEGMYVVERGGDRYAFTQLEAIDARKAFPCFDEPAFKVPYDLTLFVPKGMEAITNTREIERSYIGPDTTRVSFATTAPLPSYLLAFAVGPLDVVHAPALPPNGVRRRALPLRGVAARGRGKEMAYALAHTPEILSALEAYTGIEYPFDKLDLIAVPEKRGAMENAGAITFGERLLLLDEATAPTTQTRAFWSVTTHELAHQWFGNLVTMPWWDDTWLNEAFATWATTRILGDLRPDDAPAMARLRQTHEAMEKDSLVSARQVRQDVNSIGDIENAFDEITYRKGASVIGMFERWLGKEAFRTGLSSYLSAHAGGTATADDLFAALSVAAERDAGGAFRSFVSQPGVPLVEAKLACGESGNFLTLRQSRHLPAGSEGERGRRWSIPVCAKMPDGKTTTEACTLLTGPEGSLPLPVEKCPDWVMPNAGAAGYYVMSMPPAELRRLTTKAALRDLTPSERLAVAHAVRASFVRGVPVAELLPVLTALAGEPDRAVVEAVAEPFRVAASWLTAPKERAAIAKEARRAFAPAWREVGWAPKKGATEDSERRGLRAELLEIMVTLARDPIVRREAASRGRAYVGHGKDGEVHAGVVDRDLVVTCLSVALQEGDEAFFEHVVALFARTGDDMLRAHLAAALGQVREPRLAARALDLTFDPRLSPADLTKILEGQLAAPETRDATFRWLERNVDRLAARRPPSRRRVLPWLGAGFCDEAHASALSRLFAERSERYVGGPRNLAGALEAVRLCSARRAIQEPSFRKLWKLPQPLLATTAGDVLDPFASRAPTAGSGGLLVDPFASRPPGGPSASPPPPPPASSTPAREPGTVVDPWSKSPKAPRPPSTASPPGADRSGVIDPWSKPKKRPPPAPPPAPQRGVVDPWKR